MEKLTLEHLAPYLPYKLQMYGASEISTLIGIDYRGGSQLTLEFPLGIDYCDIIEFSPILNPLSSLTQEIEHNGEKIDVLEEIYSESWMACGFITKVRKTFIELISKEDNSVIRINLDKPQCNEQWINGILHKYHFDTKFLIEAGLAIDKTTIS